MPPKINNRIKKFLSKIENFIGNLEKKRHLLGIQYKEDHFEVIRRDSVRLTTQASQDYDLQDSPQEIIGRITVDNFYGRFNGI